MEQVNKYPGEVVVLSLGAMTNVATAINMDPTIVTTIKVIRIAYFNLLQRTNTPFNITASCIYGYG